MIKRCLIGFTVLISCFIFTNSVSALEAHNINDLDLFSEEITEDYLYETFGVSKDAFPYVVMFASENSMISGRYEAYLFFMTENDNLGLRDYKSGGVFYCTFYGDFAYYTWTSTNEITEEIDLANYTINYKGGASKGTWRGSKSKEDFYYFSNFDILTLNNPETNNLSDVKITTDVYLLANNLPSSYKFNETINSLNYSKVELIFEIPSMETNLNFNYDFHSSDNSTTFKSPYFEEVYTSCSIDEEGVSSCRPFPITSNFLIEKSDENDGQCHLDEFGLPNCYKPNDYSSDDEINVFNSYVVENYDLALNNDILTKITTSLKLVLDLEFNTTVSVDINFISSLPFEVVYYERSGVSDYYSTVDLTGKYGAVFLPVFDTTDINLNVRTLFKGVGNLDIQHRSSLDIVNYKILSAYSLNYCNEFLFNQDVIPYSCNEFSGEFEFYVSNENLNQALFFVNGHYSGDDTTNVNVTYDTRYYQYWIFETPTSIVSITNPNTGENSYISLEEFYNFADVDTGFLTDLVNQFLDYFLTKFPAVKQFQMIISLFSYNEEFDNAPVFTVSLNSVGIDQEVQIIDFSIFDQYRATVIFWEMLFITTYTIVKVTDNIVRAFKD